MNWRRKHTTNCPIVSLQVVPTSAKHSAERSRGAPLNFANCKGPSKVSVNCCKQRLCFPAFLSKVSHNCCRIRWVISAFGKGSYALCKFFMIFVGGKCEGYKWAFYVVKMNGLKQGLTGMLLMIFIYLKALQDFWFSQDLFSLQLCEPVIYLQY